MATYRHDPDLEFLRHCHRDDLDLLVSVLICDPKDGLARITETLTYDPQYKKHKPNHPRYWDAIAAEVQTFGANSFARHCCKVSDEAAFCLIQRPYISKTLLTRRISPRGSP